MAALKPFSIYFLIFLRIWCPSGEGDGNSLQYSWRRILMDWGAWQAAVRGVAKSWTRLSNLTHTHALDVPLCVHAKSLQPCLTLCDTMDCSLPEVRGSLFHLYPVWSWEWSMETIIQQSMTFTNTSVADLGRISPAILQRFWCPEGSKQLWTSQYSTHHRTLLRMLT